MNIISDRFQTIKDFLSSQHFVWQDLSLLLSWSYWTESFLPEHSPSFLAGCLFILAAIIVLIIWRVRLKRAHKLTPVYDVPINQLPSLILLIIIMTVSYIFFRVQAISYLSSRLVILITVIVCLGWLIYLIYFARRIAPSKRRYYLERERFFRYLPKVQQERKNR